MDKAGSVWSKAINILGISFDWFVKQLIIGPLERFFHISLDPSQSRWGATAFLFGLGFFLFALAAQFDSSSDANENKSMITILYAFGVVLMVLGLCLCVYFLRHPNTRDPVETLGDELGSYFELIGDELESQGANINEVLGELKNTNKALTDLTATINTLIQEIRKDRDERRRNNI